MTKRLTVRQTAAILELCVQRILAKVSKGHFEGATPCECGRSIMIPEESVKKEIEKKLLNVRN